MTEPLNRENDTNRINPECWQAAKTNQPMVFHPKRRPVSRHVLARIVPSVP